MLKRKQIHEDARKMYWTKIPVKKVGDNGEDAIWEVKTWSEQWTDNGEVLIWCRNGLGYARQRMGPKLVNCCKTEQMGTKEFGTMMKRIQTLEEERVPAKWGK